MSSTNSRFGPGTMIMIILAPVSHLFALAGSIAGGLTPDMGGLTGSHFVNAALFLVNLGAVVLVAMKSKIGLWLFGGLSLVLLAYGFLPTSSSPGFAGIIGVLATLLLLRQRALFT